MARVVVELRLKTTDQWLALNAYRLVLERIARDHEEDPWGFSGEEAAEMARFALDEWPGGFGGVKRGNP